MPPDSPSPWLTVPEAAARARCSRRVIYDAVASGRLRAAHIAAGRNLRIHSEWVDAWLAASAPMIIEVPRRDRGAA